MGINNVIYDSSLHDNISASARRVLESDQEKIKALINTRNILGCDVARVKVSDGLFFDSFEYVIGYGAMIGEIFLPSGRYSERRVSENLPSID